MDAENYNWEICDFLLRAAGTTDESKGKDLSSSFKD